jgi:hypothetical protein
MDGSYEVSGPYPKAEAQWRANQVPLDDVKKVEVDCL